jgi:hypothetical protein
MASRGETTMSRRHPRRAAPSGTRSAPRPAMSAPGCATSRSAGREIPREEQTFRPGGRNLLPAWDRPAGSPPSLALQGEQLLRPLDPRRAWRPTETRRKAWEQFARKGCSTSRSPGSSRSISDAQGSAAGSSGPGLQGRIAFPGRANLGTIGSGHRDRGRTDYDGDDRLCGILGTRKRSACAAQTLRDR